MKGTVQLQLPAGIQEELTVEVLDMLGRVCHSQTIEVSETELILDLGDVSPGIYTIRALGANRTFQGKLLLTR